MGISNAVGLAAAEAHLAAAPRPAVSGKRPGRESVVGESDTSCECRFAFFSKTSDVNGLGR